MELLYSVAEWVIQALPYDRSNAALDAALRVKHPGELLVLYLNWRNRLIPAQPREVNRSTEFDSNPVAASRSDAIAQIIDDIRQGHDLTKYLSRRVQIGFSLPPDPSRKQLNRLQHLDLLLNDWRIHHLHLSTVVEGDGFVERDDPLLFAMFMPNAAYLLDIETHSSFANEQLARIAIENWPTEQLFLELKEVRPSRDKFFSNEERSALRAVGVASFVQVGDQLYCPRGSISTAGTSIEATTQANKIMRTLKALEDEMRNDPSRIIRLIREHGGNPADDPQFKFAFFEGGFGVIETTSGFPIGLR